MKVLEKEILKYLKERKWDKLRPGDLAKSIAIESGELLELFQWDNPTLTEAKKDKEKLNEIKKELADVLMYCFDMSVLLKLDTKKIVLEKLKHVKTKYPAHLVKDSYNEKTGANNKYWEIKKEYRKKGL
ncbi:MAG: MazG-like family protein [Candidatus Paceibacterota bacterium]|jgi:NTP pyrophosphatase (non-canonical NTP hydrolase)